MADIRGDLDLTQKEMADRLHMKKNMYSKWERGIEIIPLNRINQFANETKSSLDYIAGLTNQNQKMIFQRDLDKEEVGKRLRQLRSEKGITQKELADFLNTTQSTISAYENGKVLLLSAFAYQIAKNYNVSLDWLCGRVSLDKHSIQLNHQVQKEN